MVSHAVLRAIFPFVSLVCWAGVGHGGVLAQDGGVSGGMAEASALYFGRDGVAGDPVAGCAAFRALAETGDGDGAHAFATCAHSGVGVARDYTLAAQWYGEAIRLGSVKAQCGLGNMLVQGQGGPADVFQGLALCRAAAQAGDVDAQADLGTYYLSGDVVEQDLALAGEWLKRAADQGHVDAAYYYATLMWIDEAPGGRAASAAYWQRAVLGGRRDAARWLGDALLIRLVGDVEAVLELDVALYRATRAAYQLAGDDDPDPDVRAYAREKLALLDALGVGGVVPVE